MIAALSMALVFGTVPPLEPGPAARRAEKRITAAGLTRHVRYLASDKLEGRAPGTKGDELAEKYLVDQFKALGLKPGAPEGGYVQTVELIGVTGHPEALTATPRTGEALSLRYRDDFMAVAGRPQEQTKLAGAELVFVGYGIAAPEFQWDDYKGADLKGKVLLMLNSDPDADPALFAGKTRLWYGRWDYKYESAARTGAVGALIIHTTPSAGYPWSVVQTSWAGTQFDLPGTKTPQLDVDGWVTEEAAGKLAALGGRTLDALVKAAQSRDFRPVPLGITIDAAFTSTVETKKSGNVIGVLPGGDLSSEAVFFTAHHDHLGKKADPKPGEDAIYNGALDNASGVAQLLSVAKAFRAMQKPPRRSIYFAAVAGEEQGLLGSQYLAEHPPLPLGRVAADINIDGANIWGRTRDVTAIGYGKSSLDRVVEAVAAMQGRIVTADQLPDRGFFYRSDQFNFAKLGVPSVYAESGMDVIGKPAGWGRAQKEAFEATHYHQPSDELDAKWDLSGAVEDARMYFHIGLVVANDDALPSWNPGDEFEAARKKSLEEATR